MVQMFINEINVSLYFCACLISVSQLLARTQCPNTVQMNAVFWSVDGVLIDLEYVDDGVSTFPSDIR